MMANHFFLMVAYGLTDTAFLSSCDKALGKVLTACIIITPTFMTIALAYGLLQSLVSNGTLRIDWAPIFKAVAMFFLLFFYQSLIDLTSNAVSGFSTLVTLGVKHSAGSALVTLTTPQTLAAAAARNSVSSGDVVAQAPGKVATVLNAISSFTSLTPTALLTQFFTTTTVFLVKRIMLYLQQFILGFLYICGPISMSLSVIPAFGQLGIKWFQNFLAVQFWGLSFTLLDLLYGFVADSQKTSGLGILKGLFGGGVVGTGMEDSKFMIASVIFVMMYIMVPWLTSLFIGSSAAQGFIGSVVGMAATAATSGASLVSPGFGGFAGALHRTFKGGGGGGGGGGGATGGGGAAAGGAGAAAGGGGGESPGPSASASSPSVVAPNGQRPQVRRRQ